MAYKVTLSEDFDQVALPNGLVLSGGESATLIDKYFFLMTEEVQNHLFTEVEYVGVAPGEGGMNPEDLNAEAPILWDPESMTIGVSVGTGPGDVSAGNHGHDISSVGGLQDELDNKSENGHGHSISDVTGLQSELDGKSDTSHDHDGDYAAASHSHGISDVNGLQGALDGKSDTSHDHDGDYAAVSHDHPISDVNGLQGALDGKSNTGHNHDSDYAPANHTHPISDVTNLQSELNGKLTATQASAVADSEGNAEDQLNALLASLRSAGILAE